VLDYHKKKATPEHALNRLFREYHPGVLDVPYLSPSTATVRTERWSTEQLNTTVRRDRTTIGPARTDVPVVVVQWKDKPFLVDGQRRVNQWVQQHSALVHEVFVVEPLLASITALQAK